MRRKRPDRADVSRRVEAGILLMCGALLAGCGGGCPRVEPPEPGPDQLLLLDPADPGLRETAPDTFRARFETTKGEFVVEAVRAWAPIGVDRFYNLVRNGFYDGGPMFRVVPGFVVQFGVSPIPAIQQVWDTAFIADDSVRQSNTRGTVTFAQAEGNPRTTQLFVNYGDNSPLDDLGFAPIGRVVDGMGTVLGLYGAYGDFPPAGNAPSYVCLLGGGAAYIERSYPNMDTIERATIVTP